MKKNQNIFICTIMSSIRVATRVPRLSIVARSSRSSSRKQNLERRKRLLRRELTAKIEFAIDTCFIDPEGVECTIAWMEVDEVSSALYNLMQQKDTIQSLWCDDDPSHRECREYDM